MRTKICFAVILSIVAASLAAAQIAGQDPSRPYKSPLVATCGISNTYSGAPVATVAVNSIYWLQYDSGGACYDSLKYVVKYTASATYHAGKAKEVHTLIPESGWLFCGGLRSIPFAVSGVYVVAGPAVLKVKTQYGTCTYNFTVQ